MAQEPHNGINQGKCLYYGRANIITLINQKGWQRESSDNGFGCFNIMKQPFFSLHMMHSQFNHKEGRIFQG